MIWNRSGNIINAVNNNRVYAVWWYAGNSVKCEYAGNSVTCVFGGIQEYNKTLFSLPPHLSTHYNHSTSFWFIVKTLFYAQLWLKNGGVEWGFTVLCFEWIGNKSWILLQWLRWRSKVAMLRMEVEFIHLRVLS